jgi:hypothetical protein
VPDITLSLTDDEIEACRTNWGLFPGQLPLARVKQKLHQAAIAVPRALDPSTLKKGDLVRVVEAASTVRLGPEERNAALPYRRRCTVIAYHSSPKRGLDYLIVEHADGDICTYETGYYRFETVQ